MAAAVVDGVVEAAVAVVANIFLFLLPSGRPHRRGAEGDASASNLAFLPLPVGQPHLRFFGAPAPSVPPAPKPLVADKVEQRERKKWTWWNESPPPSSPDI
jgi:hypothetical protein